jgi:hypothetical protein
MVGHISLLYTARHKTIIHYICVFSDSLPDDPLSILFEHVPNGIFKNLTVDIANIYYSRCVQLECGHHRLGRGCRFFVLQLRYL